MKPKIGMIKTKLDDYDPTSLSIGYFGLKGDISNKFLKLIKDKSKIDMKLSELFDQYELLKIILETKDLETRKKITGLYKSFLSNGLYSRSREGTRYTYLFDLINYDSGIFIIQSKDSYFGIDINETSKVIKLSKSDIQISEIYRFCYFYLQDGEIYLKAWEKSGSDYFMNWLKIPEYERLNLVDNFNFQFYLKVGINNITINISEEQLNNIFCQKDDYFRFDGDKFIIKNDSQDSYFDIDKIKIISLNKEFKNIEELHDFVRQIELDVNIMNLKYDYYVSNLKEKSDKCKFLNKIGFETNNALEISWKEFKLNIIKPLIKNEFVIVSHHDFMTFEKEFIDEIISKKEKGLIVKLYFTHMPRNDDGVKIGNIIILNKVKLSSIGNILLSNLESYKMNSKLIYDIVLHLILDDVANNNKETSFFLKYLISNVNLKKGLYACSCENDLIEYKMPDSFMGGHDKIIRDYVVDIGNKLSKADQKIYVIGIHPNTRSIVNLDNRTFNDDNIREIIEKINNKLNFAVIGEPQFIKLDENNKLLSFIVTKIK